MIILPKHPNGLSSSTFHLLLLCTSYIGRAGVAERMDGEKEVFFLRQTSFDQVKPENIIHCSNSQQATGWPNEQGMMHVLVCGYKRGYVYNHWETVTSTKLQHDKTQYVIVTTREDRRIRTAEDGQTHSNRKQFEQVNMEYFGMFRYVGGEVQLLRRKKTTDTSGWCIRAPKWLILACDPAGRVQGQEVSPRI